MSICMSQGFLKPIANTAKAQRVCHLIAKLNSNKTSDEHMLKSAVVAIDDVYYLILVSFTLITSKD